MQLYRCMIRVLCNFLHLTGLQLSLPEVRHQLNNWTLEPKVKHTFFDRFRFGANCGFLIWCSSMQIPKFHFVSFVSSRRPSPFSIEELNNWNPRKSMLSIHILTTKVLASMCKLWIFNLLQLHATSGILLGFDCLFWKLGTDLKTKIWIVKRF